MNAERQAQFLLRGVKADQHSLSVGQLARLVSG
jgi:hypothetical protein